MTDPRTTLREVQTAARRALEEPGDDEPDRRRHAAVVERYLDMEERVLFDIIERHDPEAEPVLTSARRRHRQLLEDLQTLADLPVASRPGENNLGRLRRELGEHIGAVDQWLLPRLSSLDAQQYDDLGDALEEVRQSWDESDTRLHHRPVTATVDAPGAPVAASDEPLPETPEPNEPA